MKLKELFKDVSDNDEPDLDVSVLLPCEILNSCGIALESIWQNSGYKDWVYRVDPEDPSIPLMRHVHIARGKHKSSKNMQASWNSDGTRHDSKSFNDKVGNTSYVRNLAKSVLNIPDNIALESYGDQSINIASDVTFSENGNEAYVRFSIIA